jgi:hypothetical protein
LPKKYTLDNFIGLGLFFVHTILPSGRFLDQTSSEYFIPRLFWKNVHIQKPRTKLTMMFAQKRTIEEIDNCIFEKLHFIVCLFVCFVYEL